jgi:DNA replication protein DnaC
MANTFNPNTMMMTNHIMSHFKMHSNSSFTESLFDAEFINQTLMMFIQIFAISIFTGLNTYFTTGISTIFNTLQRIFDRYIFKILFTPFITLYKFFVNRVILRIKPKHKITANISLITSSLRRNPELFETIQWFLTSDFCERTTAPNQFNSNLKEIYYMQNNKSLYSFDFYNTDKINFNVGPVTGTEMIIKFKNHDIFVYCTKDKIEINADLEASKRDNITYCLETYVEDIKSNIFEEFCEHAVRTYNKYRVAWHQLIYHNTGNNWEEPQQINSPNNIDNIILREDMKSNFLNVMNFFVNNRDYYVEHGQRYKKIILFMGHPGTGKTTLATAFAKKYKKHIYSLDFDNLQREGDLKNLIDQIPTEKAILMIDDIDHYFSNENVDKDEVRNTDTKSSSTKSKSSENDSENDNDSSDHNAFEESPNLFRNKKKSKRTSVDSPKKKFRPTIHELLSFFDGVNTKDGLIVIMCANDPSKIFKTNNVQDLALLRDQRINIICEFKLCNRIMIYNLYKSIFNKNPNQKLIDDIEEDYYAPCTISKQFVTFFEKNSGLVDDKDEELDNLLEDLVFKRIQTNRELIMNYSQSYNEANKSLI